MGAGLTLGGKRLLPGSPGHCFLPQAQEVSTWRREAWYGRI